MRFQVLVPLLLAAGLGGCNGDGTLLPQEGDPQGISFRYEGPVSGTHESSGELRVSGQGLPMAGSWAIARPDSLGGLVIAGFESTGPTTGSLFILQIPAQEEREYTCSLHGTDGGCHGRLFLGVDLDDPGATTGVYQVVSGSVTLSELTADRLRGSFALTLREPGDGGAVLAAEAGELDVPFGSDVTLANGITCLARNLVGETNERCL